MCFLYLLNEVSGLLNWSSPVCPPICLHSCLRCILAMSCFMFYNMYISDVRACEKMNHHIDIGGKIAVVRICEVISIINSNFRYHSNSELWKHEWIDGTYEILVLTYESFIYECKSMVYIFLFIHISCHIFHLVLLPHLAGDIPSQSQPNMLFVFGFVNFHKLIVSWWFICKSAWHHYRSKCRLNPTCMQ